MYVFLFIFLAERNIKNITNNFTLGFGTFVDKRTSPYVDVRPDRWACSDTYVCGFNNCVMHVVFILCVLG